MKIDNKQLTILEDGVQLIVVYDGPRGLPGRPGKPGDAGPPGRSITVKGDWNNQVTYGAGDAVAWRTLVNPGLNALWVVRDTGKPTIGVPPHLHPSEWIEIGAGQGPDQGDAATIFRVDQIGHPFTMVGQPAAYSERTGKYELADTRDIDMLAIGVICEILSPQEFAIQFTGRVKAVNPRLIFDPTPPARRGIGDWVPGRIYYLSTVPGMYQEEVPNDTSYLIMPMVMPVGRGGIGEACDLILLTWGPSGLEPAAKTSGTPLALREGELWYRRDKWPGLYVALWDEMKTRLMWVQANG